MAGQTWEERKPYMENLVKREMLNGKKEDFRLLEVGSWAGNSVLIWAEAMKSIGKKGEIVCVDPWVPYIKPEAIMPNKALRISLVPDPKRPLKPNTSPFFNSRFIFVNFF